MNPGGAIYFEPSIFSSVGGLPPVVFERSGNVNANNWLYSGRVISNKTGTPQFLDNCETVVIAVRCESVSTFSVEIYEHDGNEDNLTLLTTVSLFSSRSEDFGIADFGAINPTKGKQLAAKVKTGNCQNLKVYMLNRGLFSA